MRLLALLCLIPGAALAQQVDLPEGCTGYLTVQQTACRVSHHFTCEGDPEGWQRRIDIGEQGLSYFGTVDAETQWIESFHVFTGHSERLSEEVEDPASFTSLLETGESTYDFTTESDEIGQTRYVGTDRLTGETAVIDGVELDVTEYDITAFGPDGEIRWSSAGSEYINRDWRIFLSGTSTYVSPEGSVDGDDTPVDFVLPGEPGFLSDQPNHGCGQEL